MPPIKIRIAAGENGKLPGSNSPTCPSEASTICEPRSARSWATPRGPGTLESTEIEFDCDYNLRYEYVVQAMTAVSGYVHDGQVVKLVEKIKFTPTAEAALVLCHDVSLGFGTSVASPAFNGLS